MQPNKKNRPIRSKVAKVTRLDGFKKAFKHTNPFQLNEKDKRQLREHMRQLEIINKLFLNEH